PAQLPFAMPGGDVLPRWQDLRRVHGSRAISCRSVRLLPGFEAGHRGAGDGPFRAEMEKLIGDLKLANVDYRGRLSRQQTLAAMQGARFLVFPSEWYEGFPVTIAESFACGVPVLCSRLGG